MVTAGIFMVARMSPLFEHSETALNFVLVIGALTALLMGFLGIVNNDIKRVIAYSTLSQLGYMTVALGVSAYAGAIFHLMTHAFFKALLFLAAGSVIIAMHHEQDIRNMGGLRKYLPITYATFVVGTLALVGFPGFAGYFSKEALIAAVHESTLQAAPFAYWCVVIGVFVTAFYSFRLLFLTFHGKQRFATHDHDDHGQDDHGHDDHGHGHGGPPQESPWVVTLPLILLAIPSVVIGWPTIEPLLFGGFFGDAIQVAAPHEVLGRVREEFDGPAAFALHGFMNPVVWLAFAGAGLAWFLYLRRPELAASLRERFGALYTLLVNKYYFDWFNEKILVAGGRALGRALWRGGDVAVIDGAAVNGSARLVGWASGVVRNLQTGYLYHYAFVMIVGLSVLLAWLLLRT
jgi:NADH-quinone oxidoreductase subunit L